MHRVMATTLNRSEMSNENGTSFLTNQVFGPINNVRRLATYIQSNNHLNHLVEIRFFSSWEAAGDQLGSVAAQS